MRPAKPLLLAPFALGIAAAAATTTLPPGRTGLWETTMVMTMAMNGKAMGGNAPVVTALCSDPQVQAIEQQRMAGHGCGAMSFSGAGNTYTLQSTCPAPNGGAITTHGTMLLSGDTAMHMESDSVGPNMSGHVVADSKWVGPCPAGVRPGDRGRMENGSFVKTGNVLDAPNAP